MLHIATVHYASPRWIEIQARYLKRHIHVPFQTWSSLQDIDPSHAAHFDHVVDQTGKHSDKLNHLALEIAHEASEDDLLMFLDCDAVPIADPMPVISEALATAALVAVRRAENLDDQQPHPCFCVTTVGAWRKLPGDWSRGYRWADSQGQRRTDVGGNLLRRLELTGTPWRQILRSNRKNLDPLYFAVYGDIVYHHGAGFRGDQLSRVHYKDAPRPLRTARTPLAGPVVLRANEARLNAWRRATKRRHMRESERLFVRIRDDDPDWLSELM